ncbi:30S ribosome-binding factor RbfA [Micromonospora yangpuensis]|uniref:Ribosome-binding factor A n=1 Tax=Micromonospora yangpuensis TaxID=683228 RepID=A0A1C6UCD0_9ACTN|nr:30S ribosome-binding factor RbfA [Micromonospora yangpuensis]SCL51677.1 ribosome-binding factor A [Micromonospora yangpuensis]
MTDPAKVRRHAERVRELVASVVRSQIKDPRLGMITITDARITADLRDATVFYTVLGDAAAQAGTAAALDSANGMLRSTVGKALGLRHSPTLTFVLDDVQDQVKHIDDLLAAARNADAEVQRLAAQAKYAGDAQPYRVESDETETETGESESGESEPDVTGSDAPGAGRVTPDEGTAGAPDGERR